LPDVAEGTVDGARALRQVAARGLRHDADQALHLALQPLGLLLAPPERVQTIVEQAVDRLGEVADRALLLDLEAGAAVTVLDAPHHVGELGEPPGELLPETSAQTPARDRGGEGDQDQDDQQGLERRERLARLHLGSDRPVQLAERERGVGAEDRAVRGREVAARGMPPKGSLDRPGRPGREGDRARSVLEQRQVARIRREVLVAMLEELAR